MSKVIEKKVSFMVIMEVNKANPNGDPGNGNMPRQDLNGYGEISDVSIKRKIRNRLQDFGEPIYVQTEGKQVDGYMSLAERLQGNKAVEKLMVEKTGKKDFNKEDFNKKVCEEWADVRAFGQVFAFKGGKTSSNVIGPVSIGTAESIEPVDVVTTHITKSVNSVTEKGDPTKKTEDTMGTKHRVEYGIYRAFGGIKVLDAEKTGFTEQDAENIKEALRTLFVNDETSARPAGSMNVVEVIWWEHSNKHGTMGDQYLKDAVKIERVGNKLPETLSNFEITVDELDGVTMERIKGF